MASINEQITRISNAKSDIRSAIILSSSNKISIPETDLIDTYADKIRAIPNAVLSGLNLETQGGVGLYIQSISQTNGVISVTTGGVFQGTNVGLVPSFLETTGSDTKYLRADGTWVTPPYTLYSLMSGATSEQDGTSGLVPLPTKDDVNKFLMGNGSWTSLPVLSVKSTGTGNAITEISVDGHSLSLTKGRTFSPFVHSHSTSDINLLTGYKIATVIGDLSTTDTLNQALGKLEYKSNLGVDAYNWYLSVVGTDTDDVINKWEEIVEFIKNVKETDDDGNPTDILDEFVTRKTAQTITGLKTFECKSESDDPLKVLVLKNSGWTANMSTSIDIYNGTHQNSPKLTSRIEDYMNDIGYSGGNLRFSTQLVSTKYNPNTNGLVERMCIKDNGEITFGTTSNNANLIINGTISSGDITGTKLITSGGNDNQFVKGDGSLDNNSYALSDHTHDYLPLTGGTLMGSLCLGQSGILGFGSSIDSKYTDTAVIAPLKNAVWLATTGGGGESAGIMIDEDKIRLWSPMDSPLTYVNSNNGDSYNILHSGNYTTYTPILNDGDHATKASVIYTPTTVGKKGAILTSNGSGAPSWNNIKCLSFNLSDNGGRDSYLLIAELSNWVSGTLSDTYLIGTIYGHRGGNLSLTDSYNIVAQCTSYVGGTLCKLYTSIYSNGSVLPYVVKYNNKNYLALRKRRSGDPIYFTGIADGLLSNYITLNVAPNNTLPTGMTILYLPSLSWYSIATTTLFDGTAVQNIYHSGNLNAANLVTLSTAQTITGTKTFNAPIMFGTSNSYGLRTVDNYGLIGETSNRFYQCYVKYSYSTNGFWEDSDERLKNIIKPIEVNLDDLSKLRKIYYVWKNTKDDLSLQLGMIAQDVQKLYPELINIDKDTGYLSLAYDRLSVIALKGIDKLYDEIKKLKARIETLEYKKYGNGH